MKLSRASSYAVHALTHMARQLGNEPLALHLTASESGIPKTFLRKALMSLVDAGVLHSVKGWNGGYALARHAKQITLLEVVEAVDGPIRGMTPGVGHDGADAIDKRLQAVCDEAAALVRGRLAKVTLAELAKGK